MHKQEYTTSIKASKERVWQVLWDDESFRDWASLIDEGTYMKGELKEGNVVQFISSHGGYGVSSLVEKLIPAELIVLKHQMDTKDSGESQRDEEWTGGSESYRLTESDGFTTLIFSMDAPPSQEELMSIRVPQALARIKVLAEGA